MVTSIFYFFYYLVATLTMESVKTAEVMLRGNVSGNYIAMNTKGELYSTVSQTGDCLKFNVPRYPSSYTKRTPNRHLTLLPDNQAPAIVRNSNNSVNLYFHISKVCKFSCKSGNRVFDLNKGRNHGA